MHPFLTNPIISFDAFGRRNQPHDFYTFDQVMHLIALLKEDVNKSFQTRLESKSLMNQTMTS